ncbi:hypothetical protein BS78_02G078900 [Paspalum vaginatum]|nr:hypothetical protein BS78_02G078900 [Paspalum vaginatum]
MGMVASLEGGCLFGAHMSRSKPVHLSMFLHRAGGEVACINMKVNDAIECLGSAADYRVGEGLGFAVQRSSVVTRKWSAVERNNNSNVYKRGFLQPKLEEDGGDMGPVMRMLMLP